MMLLGIVVHVVTLYIDYPVGRIPDAQTSAGFNIACFLLHSFRMPAFFLISGFFAALLWERRGAWGFIVNRTGRIAVPLVVGWLPLFVLTWMTLAFAARQSGAKFIVSNKGMSPALFVRDYGLVHLWFLYYLIIYYVLSLGAFAVWRMLPTGVHRGARAYFRRFALSPPGLALLSLLTFPALFNMPLGILEAPLSFIPRFWVVFIYGLFFGFGLALYSQRDLLLVFQKGAWTRLAAGLAVFPLNYAAIQLQGSLFSTDLRARAMAAATGSLMAWLLALGLLGLFVKYCNEQNRYIRYVTDASYWLYLAHPPLVNYVGGVLAPQPLPLWVKLLLNLVIVTPLLLLTYHFCVRSTFIGKTLNGRRYPRSLPEMEAGRSCRTAFG